MLCPLCRIQLKMTDRQGVGIDYCPECRGVWLDRGELDKIIERSQAALPAAKSIRSAEQDDHRYGHDRGISMALIAEKNTRAFWASCSISIERQCH